MDALEKERTLARLMERHGDAIVRLCTLHLRDAQLAQDAAQETFLKAYRALEQFRGESSEKTWLSRIAINTCRSMRRSAWFRLVDLGALRESLPAPEQPFGVEEDEMTFAIAGLRAKYREVILLYYYQQMRVAEIAQALGIPEKTVSTRLSRARNMLRLRLEGGKVDDTARA